MEMLKEILQAVETEKISQAALVKVSGLPRSTVSMIAGGQTKYPRHDTVMKLAKAMPEARRITKAAQAARRIAAVKAARAAQVATVKPAKANPWGTAETIEARRRRINGFSRERCRQALDDHALPETLRRSLRHRLRRLEGKPPHVKLLPEAEAAK